MIKLGQQRLIVVGRSGIAPSQPEVFGKIVDVWTVRLLDERVPFQRSGRPVHELAERVPNTPQVAHRHLESLPPRLPLRPLEARHRIDQIGHYLAHNAGQTFIIGYAKDRAAGAGAGIRSAHDRQGYDRPILAVKATASPPSPQPKQWNVPCWGLTRKADE